MLFPKKASVKQVLLRFFAPLYAGKGNFKQRQASCLSGLYPKGCSEGAWKIWQNLYLRSYLRNGDLFVLSLRLLLLSLLAQVFIEQAWICDSSGGSL